jgi:nucleotide-binding universal stress UspA family protein
MLDDRPTTTRRRRRSTHPPFPRILCAVDGTDEAEAAIEQAIAIADGDARIVFAASWYGSGSPERAIASEKRAREAVTAAVTRGREAGVESQFQIVHAPRLGEALMQASSHHDLVVVGAHPRARATGIVLGETATLLVHRSRIPVLIARETPLSAGVVVGTRARPADRRALTAAAHLAARLGAELTVVHVPGSDDERHRPELRSELANARALLGRELDYLTEYGSPARAIVGVADHEGAGLIVVGSRGRLGIPALSSVSERVAHLAPCSVLVIRGA